MIPTLWWKRRLRAFAGQAPTPVASDVAASSVRLTWTLKAGAVSYDLQRADPTATTWTSVHKTGTGLTHLDEGLQPGSTYLYRLTVANAAGQVVHSPTVSVTTLTESTAPPTPPTGPDVLTRTPTSITLSTPPVAGATRYIVQKLKA